MKVQLLLQSWVLLIEWEWERSAPPHCPAMMAKVICSGYRHYKCVQLSSGCVRKGSVCFPSW